MIRLEEMIYLFKAATQKVSSYIGINLEDEEIISLLNIEQNKIILNDYDVTSNSKRVSFEMNQRRKADLRAIHVPDYSTTAYLTDESNKLKISLPNDFLYLTSLRPTIYYNPCDTITYDTNISTTSIYLIPVLPFLQDDFGEFKIAAYDGASNTLIINVTDFDNYGSEYIDDFGKHLATTIFDYLTTLTAYWEVYKDKYYPNTLIIEDSADSGTLINYGFGDLVDIDNSVEPIESISRNHTSFSNGFEKSNLDVKEITYDELTTALANPFTKPINIEPLATQTENSIFFYKSSDSTIKDVKLSYIRRPKRMSILLKQDCELSSPIQQRILDNAIQSYLLQTESQSYERKERANAKQE